MQLESYVDKTVASLLQQVRIHQTIDQLIKQNVPSALGAMFQVACIEETVLVVFAQNNMVANRLKWFIPQILSILEAQGYPTIKHVKIKIMPQTAIQQKSKNCVLTPGAVKAFNETAQKVSHHPELAQALLNLVAHQK